MATERLLIIKEDNLLKVAKRITREINQLDQLALRYAISPTTDSLDAYLIAVNIYTRHTKLLVHLIATKSNPQALKIITKAQTLADSLVLQLSNFIMQKNKQLLEMSPNNSFGFQGPTTQIASINRFVISKKMDNLRQEIAATIAEYLQLFTKELTTEILVVNAMILIVIILASLMLAMTLALLWLKGYSELSVAKLYLVTHARGL